MLGAEPCRAERQALTWERARCCAVRVEAHQFAGEPNARLEDISIGRLVGEGSGRLHRLVLCLERSCATHLVPVALRGLCCRWAIGRVTGIAKETGSQQKDVIVVVALRGRWKCVQTYSQARHHDSGHCGNRERSWV